MIKGKTYVPQIINSFGYVNRITSMATHYAISKNWGCFYKNTHISASTHPKTLNLVSNLFKDIAVVLAGWICKLSNLNIHEFQ